MNNAGIGMLMAGAAAADEAELKPVRGPQRSQNAINPIVKRVNAISKRLKTIEGKNRGPTRALALANGMIVLLEFEATQVEIAS